MRGIRAITSRVSLIMLAVLVVAGALVVAYVLSGFLNKRMDFLRAHLVGEINRRFALSLEYDSMSPSFLRAAEIRGLRLREPGGRLLVSAEKISFHYNLARLLRGGLGGSISGLSASGLRVELDLGRDASLVQKLREAIQPQNKGEARPSVSPLAQDFWIALEDSSCRISGEGLSLGASDLSGKIAFVSQGLSTDLACQLSLVGLDQEWLENNQLRCRVKGLATPDLGSIQARMRLEAETDGFWLKPQDFSLVKRGQRIEVAKVADLSPIDLRASCDLGEGNYSLDLDCAEFSPSSIGRGRGRFSSYNAYLASVASGSLSLSGNYKKSSVAYTCDMEVSLEKALLAPHTKLDLKANGDGHYLRQLTMSLRDDQGSLSLAGGYDIDLGIPDATLSLDYPIDALRLKTEGRLTGRGRKLNFFAEEAYLNELRFTALALDAELRDATIAFNVETMYPEDVEGDKSAAAFSTEIMGDVEAARFSLNGEYSLGPKPYLDLNAVAEALPSRLALSLGRSYISLPGGSVGELIAGFTLDAELFVATDFKRFSYNAPNIVFSYDKKQGNYGVLSLSGGNDNLEVSKMHLFWNEYDFSGGLRADFSDHERTIFDLDFKVDDVPYDFAGQILADKQLVVRGGYGMELHGNFDGPELLFALKVNDLPIPLDKLNPHVSMDVAGRFRDLSDWGLAINSLKVEQAGSSLLGEYSQLGLKGSLSQAGGSLEELVYQDSVSSLRGRADLGYSLKPDHVSMTADLELRGDSGESYVGLLGLTQDSIMADMEVRHSPLMRIPQLGIMGYANADLKVGGSLGAPNCEFDFGLVEAEFRGMPLGFSGKGSYADARLAIGNMDANYAFFQIKNGSFGYSAKDSLLGLRADLLMNIGQSPLRSRLILDGSILSAGLFSPEVHGRLEGLSFGPYSRQAWPLSIRRQGKAYALQGGESGELAARLDDDGAFSIAARSPSALRGSIEGRLLGDQIDARLSSLEIDAPVLWRLFGTPVLDISEGVIMGDIRVSGKLADPDYDGQGRTLGLRLSVPDFVRGVFGPINESFTVEANRLDLGPLVVSSGQDSAKVGLEVLFERWLPAGFNVRLQTQPGAPLRAVTTLLGFDINGKAHCDLTIKADQLGMLLSGAILMEEATIGMSFVKEEEQEPSDWNYAVRLSISAGRHVQFTFPNKNIPWLQTNFEPNSRLMVQYDAGQSSYSLKGAMTLRGGQIFWSQSNFYLKEGSIRFNENEKRFDPLVTIEAERRDQDERGDVTLKLIAKDSRLSNFSPHFETSPPRSEQEILAMVSASAPLSDAAQALGESDTSKAGLSLVSTVGDVAAQFVGMRYVENTIRDALALDVFSVRTQVLQNILIGAMDSSTPIDSPSSLGNYFENTTIMAGKYISNGLYLQGLIQAANDYTGNLEWNSEFSLEWGTPYFRVLWNLKPRHWDELFVRDQSLGVYWTLSF